MRPGRWCAEHSRWECVHDRKRGGDCHGSATAGTDSCRMHIGSKTRQLAGKIMAARVGHWAPIEIHPAEALLEEVYYWTGLCAFLDHVVGSLQREEMTWGTTRHTIEMAAGGKAEVARWEQAAGLNTWVEWQRASHSEKAKVARMALEGDAEARMLDLAEGWAARSVQVWESALGELGLSPEQWERARVSFPAALARLGG